MRAITTGSPSAVTSSAASRSSIVEPVLADEEADAAAQGDPAEADAWRVAEPGGEAVFASRLGVVAGRDAGLRPGGAAVGVDLDRVHRGEVEDDPALGRAVPRAAVAAAAHRELGARLPCQGNDAGDIGCVGDADDRCRPAVEAGEENATRLVVCGVVRADHLAVQAGAEVGDREIGNALGVVGCHVSSSLASGWGQIPSEAVSASALGS